MSVWITSLSWTRRICAGSCENMLSITTRSEHTGRWTKMLRSLARFSGSEPLIHTRSSAAFITITSGVRFLVHTTLMKIDTLSLNSLFAGVPLAGEIGTQRSRKTQKTSKSWPVTTSPLYSFRTSSNSTCSEFGRPIAPGFAR